MIVDWMDQFVELGVAWLSLMLLAAWRALPILVLVIGIVLTLRRRLTPSLHAFLLTIVIIRLLIPISIGSQVSLHKPIDAWLSSETDESINRTPQQNVRYQNDHKLVWNPDEKKPIEDAWAMPQSSSSWLINLTLADFLIAAMVWSPILVSAFLVFRAVYSQARFALRLRYCHVLDDRSLIDLVLRECDSLGIGRRPIVREVPSLNAPAVFGLFRKTICLPRGLTETLSEPELRWVIRHELAHIRRRDIPVVIIASIANALHWFNPIVWIITSRLRAAIEIAADRLALQGLSSNDACAYGNLLLRFAQENTSSKRSPTLGLISFASGKHLKKRVELLMGDRKPSGLAMKFLSAGLVGAIALSGLTDARETTEQRMPNVNLIASDAIEFSDQPTWPGLTVEEEPNVPKTTQSYDVSSILKTIPNHPRFNVKPPFEQFTTWVPIHPLLVKGLRLEGQTLIAELTATQHMLLQETLEAWKNGEPRQITVATKFIHTDIETASTIDWVKNRISGLTIRGLGPAIAARVDETELTQLIQRVSAKPSGRILHAPKVTHFDGHAMQMADLFRRPFVTGVDPQADGRMEPVLSIVEEGLSFFIKSKSSDDGGITMDFKLRVSGIGKVSYANLPIIRSGNSEKEGYTVQVPATEQYEVSATVKLAAGESVVLAIPRVFDNEPGAEDRQTVIVSLTPRMNEND
jgi:beta-lactamase regulating signal transducer with metallopeptidase domain